MKTITGIALLIGVPIAAAIAAPDIEVRKSVNTEFPMANEPVEFTIQVSNIGDEPAADLLIFEQLPAEMGTPEGTAAFPSTGSYDAASGEWVIGNLDPGAGAVLVVPAIVTDPLPPPCIVNSASSEFPDVLNDSNDEARAAIHQAGVERCVDLDVSFGISANPPIPIFPTCDSEERYSGHVELINRGPDAARNVVVTIAQSPVVGPDLRFDDSDCSNTASSQCRIAEIATGQTVTIDVTSDLYRSYDSFTQTISVSVTTSDVDYELANNDPSATGSAGGFSSCVEPDFGLPNVAIGPGCFIATAAYGSPLDPRLDSLRSFRDRFMKTNSLGRAMIRFYYRHSPPLADFIATRDWLRVLVRGFLTPIVFTIEYPGRAGLILLSLAGVILVRRRRRHVVAMQTSG